MKKSNAGIMRAPQLTKNLIERIEIVDLQKRGLEVKRTFLRAGQEKFLQFIIAQAMNERLSLSPEERQRISQILNGNVQPVDVHLLELSERAAITVKQSKRAA